MPLASIEAALEELRRGKLLIVVDDEQRENEGDLVMAAEKVTPEAINFVIHHARGLVCMPVMGERLDQLGIPSMVNSFNTAKHGTAFAVSVDYRKGTTTGISAQDRAATFQAIADPQASAEDFARPGHVLPLRYHEGGVLVRAGHTEAAVDLARMAGLYPAGLVCEIMKDDGSMARMADLEEFSRQHGLLMLTIAQIISYRQRKEKLVQKVAETRLPTASGAFNATAFRSTLDRGEPLALVMGQWQPEEPVLVRIHSECLTGDVFGSQRCDCGEQIKIALKMIADEGRGVFIYLRQEGRGIGLFNKIKAYSLQDNGLDTVEANESLGFDFDLRHYGTGAQMLVELGVRKLRLLTSNPRKMVGLGGYGLEVVERIPIDVKSNEVNRNYIEAKRHRMGHFIEAS